MPYSRPGKTLYQPKASLAGWVSARLLLPGISAIIAEAGFLRPNYRGEQIPAAMGVVLFLSVLGAFTLLLFLMPRALYLKALLFLFALAGYTCLGLIDDFWGSDKHRGLKGHLRSLLRGSMTTGSLKALAGLKIAFIAAISGGKLVYVPLDTLVIALSVNAVNLLDLRPGRAGKAFLLFSGLILAACPNRTELIFLAITAGSLLACLPSDLKARSMMGDSGANALGAVLGLTASWVLELNTKAVCLAALVMLHLLAEKYSLTKIISSNRLLDYFDRMGREK